MTELNSLSAWLNRHRSPDITDRCHICGKFIVGKPLYCDPWGHYSCASHGSNVCFVCLEMCDDSSLELPGYGYLCSRCASKEIDPASALRIVDYVGQYFLKSGISGFPGYKLHLASAQEMIESADGLAAGGLAYSFDGQCYRIKVLKNLSKIAFAGVFAHELLHLWQYAHKINAPDPICEGFCNLGKYLVLALIARNESYPHMSYMLQNDDVVYGEGFRTLKVLHDVVGWKGVLEKMRSFK